MRTKPLILIVDDDEDIREILKIFLEADGHHVQLAADGCDAWRRLSIDKPTLIILDWMMPHMDGEQFLKKLHASRYAKIPVIIMSGSEAALNRARALKTGCLKKPVEFDELLSVVRESERAPRSRLGNLSR
jgi:two-component system phosphate regulon response regulator PhoB